MRNIVSYVNNEKGTSDVIVLLIVTPIILTLSMYIIVGGLFLVEQNEMTTIVNKKLDRALVEGQFTASLKNELITELDKKGFKKDKLEVNISPTTAGDSNNTSYVIRGNEIEITVIYKVAHSFYKLNSMFSTEDKYYIKTKVTGMSEKW